MSQNSNTQPLALQPPASHFRMRPVTLHDIEPLRAACWSHRTPIRCRTLIRRILYAESHQRGLGVVVLHPENETHIIAYGQMMHWTTCAEISDLMVLEEYRSQGIGTALIQHLIQHLPLKTITCIEIGAAATNERALALYRRLGFKDSYILDLEIGGDEKERVIYLQILLGDSG